MSLIVKICGLSTRETLDVALQAGADMVGFVFFPASPRHLGLETARDLGSQAKARAIKVALTVDADDATLANIVEALQPDILQLHGRETVARLRDIKQTFGLQVMKAIAIETPADLASLPGYAAVADLSPRPPAPPWPVAFCSMPAHPGAQRVPAVLARCSTGMYLRISISSCRSCDRVGLMPQMLRRPSASRAPAASMFPRA